MRTLRLETPNEGFVSITRQVNEAVEASGVQEGICLVYCPHTTAGITLNENADPDVKDDLLLALNEAFPHRAAFRHMEGNSAAHAKAACVGSSATVPIQDGRLALGRWQDVYFCEFDGPRSRQVHLQILRG